MQNGSSFDLVLKAEVTNKGRVPAKIISISLDKKMKSVVLKESPPITLAHGTEKVVEDSLKITHSATIASTWKAEAGLKGKLSAGWAEVEVGIKAGIEKTTSKTYSVASERKRSVTLKGDGSTPAPSWSSGLSTTEQVR